MAKHDLGDIEKIRANLQGWLRQKLPNAENLELDELKFPEESGESSVSLILKTKNNGEEQRFVCRMKPRVSEVFNEHDLPMQYRLMELCHENGIPVPPLYGFEEDESLVGSDFYIMGFVDGVIPIDNPPYAFGSWVTELSDDERARMWSNGLQTMAKVHQIPLDSFDSSFLPRSAEGESPVQHEITKLNGLISDDIRAHLVPVLVEAMDYVNNNFPSDGPRRICWGDSRVGNVIWKDLDVVALIDWEMASIADPLMDVSWWYWIDYANSVGLGLERLGGLPPLEEIYQQWSDITGLPTDNSGWYDLFNILRYAIILETKFAAMRKAGMDAIDNFVAPFVEQELNKVRAAAEA